MRTCVCVCLSVHVCWFVRVHAVSVCMFMHMRASVCAHVCVCVCVSVCVYARACSVYGVGALCTSACSKRERSVSVCRVLCVCTCVRVVAVRCLCVCVRARGALGGFGGIAWSAQTAPLTVVVLPPILRSHPTFSRPSHPGPPTHLRHWTCKGPSEATSLTCVAFRRQAGRGACQTSPTV